MVLAAAGVCWTLAPAMVQAQAVNPTAASNTSRPTASQLKAAAEQAERQGHWETAFTLYCQLYLADRSTPELCNKLHQTWRRLLQHRRHRDPDYQRFVQSLSVADALDLLAEVLSRVPQLYVDRERARPQQLWSYGLEELARALDDPAFQTRVLPQANPELLQQMKAEAQQWRELPIQQPRQGRQQLRRLLIHWQQLTEVAQPAAVILEVVHGACNSLDENSQYQPPLPPPAEELQPQGVCLHYGEGAPVIAGIVRGSWAELHTPLRAGQVVLQINGHDLSEGTASPDDVREALRHPQQGWHDLVVATGDPAMPELAVSLPVQTPSIYGRTVRTVRADHRIGYLRIATLRDSTPRELDEALLLLQQDGIEALVLDLRDNMGGSFTAALEVASRFLSRGVIVTTQGQLPEVNNVAFSSEGGTAACKLPLVVLINGQTASAAEMLAAALKDQQRATLVGAPTFGKGTLQYPLVLEWTAQPATSATPSRTTRAGTVRLTIARLISPAGYPLHLAGVQPHLLETDPATQLQAAFRKAVELLPAVDPPMTPDLPPSMSDPLSTPPDLFPDPAADISDQLFCNA